MLLDGGPTYAKAAKRISSGAFWTQKNRIIWEAFGRQYDEHGAASLEGVAESLRDGGQLAAAGGFEHLVRVSDRQPTTAAADFFIDQLHDLWVRREAIKVAESIVEQCRDGQVLDSESVALGDHVQRLQDLSRNSRTSAKLPPIVSWEDFEAEALERPPELVAGVLHRGAKMMLAGGSKSFKTWVLTDLGMSVATGAPWWGKRTERGRVLYVNYELIPVFFRDRMQAIAEAKSIPAGSGSLDVWNLRGHAGDLSDQASHFINQTAGVQYSLIILDPIYKCLGERDENSNGDVAELLNLVESLAVKTGAALAYGHHFSKGNQSEKSSIDRMSGAGAWARDPDALVTLTPHEEDEHFVAEFTLRNLKPLEPMVVRWEFPCMRPEDGLDPSALRKAGRPKSHLPKAIADLVAAGASTFSQIVADAKAKGISESSTKRLLKQAIEIKLIEKVGSMYLLPKR